MDDWELRLPRPSTALPAIVGPRNRRGDTVAGRSRPAYDALGVRAGSFIVFPEVAAGIGYDSNVYRQPSGSSDAFTRLRGSVLVQSDLPRHALTFDGFVDQRLSAKYTTENALTYDAHLAGQLDVNRTDRLVADVRHSHLVAERGATGEILRTREPIRFDVTSVGAGGRKAFGRLNVDVGGFVSYADYQNAQTPAGARLDQQYRDFTLYQLSGGVGYALPAGPELFVSVTGQARRYRVAVPPITRDADSIEILGGVRSDITPLLRGQIGIGYFYADFKDPTIASRGSLGLDIRLDYLVTDFTTLRASARRELQNVASAQSPAALVTEGRFGADHELLRNVIISASVGIQNASYITAIGKSRRYTADGSAQWLLNRRFRIDFDVGYRRRDGGGQTSDRNYSEFRSGVGVAYRL